MTNDAHQEINARIGVRVKALRISKGVSPHQIAAVLGSTTNRVTRVENGKSDLSAAELIGIAQALGVLVSVLVGEMPADGGAQ